MMLLSRIKSVWQPFAALLFLCLPLVGKANVLEHIRVWPAPDETRVVMDLSAEASFTYFTLSKPDRLVVDLKQTSLKARLPISIKDSPVLTRIRRSGAPDKGTYRLVFELKKSRPFEIFKLAPTPKGEYGHRLVVDIAHDAKAVQSGASQPEAPKAISRDASQFSGNADIVVAVDAGHGGEDPGSIGPTRKYEKSVTLQVARKIAAQIDAVPGMKAVLTRSGDYFVNLNRRSEIARQKRAHLLVSIHADAFSTPQPRGASVFVLNTKRANTEIAKWVENHEQQSELLGGAGQVLAKSGNDKNISQTLLDLQFSHSQKEGYKLAKDLLAEMGKVAYLHKKEPVNASLAVLKSPDIPSVLIETGFISNPGEEKLLVSSSHQNKLAKAISRAIVTYFEDNPPEGTRFASQKYDTKYSVQRGDSLSIIAQKFSTDVDAIKAANSLKSTSLAIGQVLVIPRTSISTPQRSTTTQLQTETVTHVVKRGEYLGKIASDYGVSVAAIRKENSLKSSTLSVGQKLRITTTKKVSVVVRKHKVARGDYLGKIARQYDVSIASLRQTNKLRSDTLSVGQILIIPNR